VGIPGETRLRFLGDVGLVLVAIIVSTALGLGVSPGDRLSWVAVTAMVALVAFAATGSYRAAPRLGYGHELRPVVPIMGLATLGVAALRGVVAPELAAAPVLETWLLLTAAVLLARTGTRALLASSLVRDRVRRRTLIVGAGDVGRIVARRLRETPGAALEPIGYLDKEPRDAPGDDLPVLGASWDLERVVAEHDVAAVVVGYSTAPTHVLLDLVRRAWAMHVNVLVVPRLFEVEGTRISMQHLGALPLVALDTTDPAGWQFRVKYAIDRVVAALTLAILSPVLLAVAGAVLLTTGRPILYRQRRVGCDGQVFEMLKFRTMRGSPTGSGEADAEWAAAVLGEEFVAAASGGEDRRTPLGSFLRKWSLDELPQIINVLRGEMSLVGPRPERDHYVERFSDAVYRYAERHRVRSGITGWAQVHGLRGETSLADRVEWDNYYIENWSLWLDLMIVARSLRAVLGHRNAR
jgi:exopolysaccharide biosynthesis polyprenyl glycosylphosphotransferase